MRNRACPVGLRRDDLINEEENPVVQEAIRRLPANEIHARHFRLKRVCVASHD